MQSASNPPDEVQRLLDLRSTGLLDSEAETAFDEIVELAALTCGFPVALVSLVDADRQWFKARLGLEASETPRDVAFCAHAILEPGQLLEVPDSAADARFVDNPLATGDPWVRAYYGMPIRAGSGSAIGTLCVIDHEPHELEDKQKLALQLLARRVEAEIALRAGRDAALAAVESKERFLQTMSHEIRTPLAGMLGTLELALDEDLPPSVASDLATAQESGRVLKQLLDTVLEVSRARAGGVELDWQPVGLRPLLRSTLATFGPSAEAKQVRLELSVDPELEVWLRTDGTRLGQVLNSLVGNAVKFTDEGSVELAVERREDRVHFRVADTGRGIAEEDLQRVFQAFEQVAATDRGTGLGLALANELVALLGGQLEATSELGKGSEFCFDLPYVPVTPPVPSGGVDEAVGLIGRVLLVDDEPVNRTIGRRNLERLGVGVSVASGGVEALELIESEEPDLVLLDCQMDDLDGFEVARRARGSGYAGPIVALTASATDGARKECRASGMDEVLEKPIDRVALSAALAHFMAVQGIERDAG